jgi:hypothetical protein
MVGRGVVCLSMERMDGRIERVERDKKQGFTVLGK